MIELVSVEWLECLSGLRAERDECRVIRVLSAPSTLMVEWLERYDGRVT